MKNVLGLAVGLVVLSWTLPTGAQAPAPTRAVDVTVAAIQAVLKTAPADAAADLPIRVADAGGYYVGVYVVNRPKVATPPAIYHETKVTEVVIPGYVPHWWSHVESDMSYLVIRPDPDKILPLK